MKTKLLFSALLSFSFYLLSSQVPRWQHCRGAIDSSLVGAMAIDPATKYIYAGTWTGIFRSADNGSTWDAKNTGLSHPGLRVLSMAISGKSIYLGTYGGGIFLSADNGESWIAANNGLSDDALIVKSIAAKGNNIYIGTYGGGVYVSPAKVISWKAVNDGLSGNDMTVLSVALSGSRIFIGTIDGNVFSSACPGISWTHVLSAPEYQMYAPGSVNCVGVTKENYLVAGSNSGVFLSADNGNKWTALNKGMRDSTVISMSISGNALLAGTHGGSVYISFDNGKNWKEISDGLSKASVISVAAGDKYYFAGTGGKGIWKLTH